MSLTAAAQPMVKAWEAWRQRKEQWELAGDIDQLRLGPVDRADASICGVPLETLMGRLRATQQSALRTVIAAQLERGGYQVVELRLEGGRWWAGLRNGEWRPVSDLLQSREVAQGRAA